MSPKLKAFCNQWKKRQWLFGVLSYYEKGWRSLVRVASTMHQALFHLLRAVQIDPTMDFKVNTISMTREQTAITTFLRTRSYLMDTARILHLYSHRS